VRGVVGAQVAAGGSGLSRVELYADGGLVGTDFASPFLFSWATAGLSNGSHTLQARAFDAAGHAVTSPPMAVTVDNVPPSLWIANPTANGLLSGSAAKLAGWATDAAGIGSLSFAVDGQAVAVPGGVTWLARPDVCSAVPTGDPRCPEVGWRVFLDSTRLANGAHVLGIVATDAAGNTTLVSTPFTASN
jgi:hypothetical protein